MSLQLVCTLTYTHTLFEHLVKQQKVVCNTKNKSDIEFTENYTTSKHKKYHKKSKKKVETCCLKRLDIKRIRDASTKLDHSVGHSRNPIKCASRATSLGSAACCKIRCMT